ncbi:nitroreductase family protein [Halosquirtibacter xylanolyticus]|uniref:nitroreductase family protein n=1 Tax=Halosquirtibacter xylanolyticus TaxID=3374599 RepID=UPI003749813A|nr:nitroreductase family protein [Prolixibacteraceae bacterium]
MGSLLELIKQRRSTRTFENTPLLGKLCHDVHEIVHKDNSGPFKTPIIMKLIDRQEYILQNRNMGTYGFVRGIRSCIIGILDERSTKGMVDYGYIIQKKVIKLLGMKLGTCWMGGSFNRSEFKEALSIPDTKFIPAIIPVGKALPKSFIEKALCSFVKSKTRRPFEELFFNEDLSNPIAGTQAEELYIPLEMVRWAPSVDNTQPWRLIIDGNCVHFYMKKQKSLESSLVHINLNAIDMGIAMAHFEIGCNEVKKYGSWQDSKKEDLQCGHYNYIITWKFF